MIQCERYWLFCWWSVVVRSCVLSRWRRRVQVISLEGWVDIMYYVQDAHSFWDWVYFVALIVVSMRGRVHISLVPSHLTSSRLV